MLVSGGQLLAIDKVYADNHTIEGDGVDQSLRVNTNVMATNDAVDAISSSLRSDIQTIYAVFDNYYTKSETSGSEQLTEEFDSIKKIITTPYELTSLTPDILYASVSADEANNKFYVTSATAAKDELMFDGAYDPIDNKIATVETVANATQSIAPIMLRYNEQIAYTWEELQKNVPNIYVVDEAKLYALFSSTVNELVFRCCELTRLNDDNNVQADIREIHLKSTGWDSMISHYQITDPWSTDGTGIEVSTGRISTNIDDSTIKINDSNQLYVVKDVQHVTFDSTTWIELDFSKNLVLDISRSDIVANASVYNYNDEFIQWLVILNDVHYTAKLTNTNVWTLQEVVADNEIFWVKVGSTKYADIQANLSKLICATDNSRTLL